MGDAGMILTDDDGTAERCKSIRVHGMGRERYYYDHVGYTSRMDEVQAAFMRVKLRRLGAWNDRRGEIANVYLSRLKDLDYLTLPTLIEGNESTWHQFAILSPRRDELMAHLKAAGIDSMIYYPVPLHFHAPYAEFAGGKGSLPATEQICREVLCLPIHAHLSDEAVNHIVETIRSAGF